MDFQNRIKGGLLALAVGDALGAPHEFRYSLPVSEYTGKLSHPIKFLFRYTGYKYSVVGQVTDDTSMAIALLETIVRNKDWREIEVIDAYLQWANSGHSFLGRNTRALFKGIKTLSGYRNRYAKRDLSKVESNGSLMRALPLALLYKYQPQKAVELAVKDTQLTNPSAVNVDAIRLYMFIVGNILDNVPISDFLTKLQPRTEPIKQAVEQGLARQERNIRESKGWIAHAIYLIIVSLALIADKPPSSNLYPMLINWIIRQGGDTDTNAAIVGGVLGLYLGYERLIKNATTRNNIKITLAADPSQGQLPIDQRYLPATGLLHLESI